MAEIKAEAKRLFLNAPASFWATDEATLAMITGGCGPGRFGNFGWFDSMFGLSVKPACAIHDFEYSIGISEDEKKKADSRMLANMLTIINNKRGWWFVRMLRRYRATSYYNAVVECGWPSFVSATIVDTKGLRMGTSMKAPWYDVALREMRLGVKEVPGVKHNQKILEYHKTTSLMAKTDEVPWCSSFVNWCMLRAGVSRTDKANAQSWLTWGEALEFPRLGCVVVFKRGLKTWQGHVGFFAGYDKNGNVLCLGGNQKNTINISAYPEKAVLGYRWAGLK